MTRRIMIMRHAKAERGEGKADFDRMLEPRGFADADRVAHAFTEAGLRPDRVLCSASRRTRDTLAAVLPHLSADCTVELRGDLYEAETPELQDAVRLAAGSCILVIGHNPATHGVASAFAAGGPGAAVLARGFPTSTCAVFTMGFGLDTVRFERLFSP
jgi:phosphohistidine phosphatase